MTPVMTPHRRALALCFLVILTASPALPQAETVPVYHPVYSFLKKMEVKGVIGRYHDAVLPLSRNEVAGHLRTILENQKRLSPAEQEWMSDYRSEFQYELTGSVSNFDALVSASGEDTDSVGSGMHAGRERVALLHADSLVTLFVNGLVDLDARRISGDGMGSGRAEYLQFGARARGTLLGHVGFSLQVTNAQFWGSRALLAQDRHIRQSHALGVTNAQNFDFAEGSVRYDAGIISLQVGRERVLWGSGYGEKMTLSDNPRVFDHIRTDVTYGAVRYTFLHAWLLGTERVLRFSFPTDTTSQFAEPVIADKYFAAHRLELSFPGVLSVGLQEMVVYSNRSVDLAYLSPLSFIESVQRSRGERDNVFWAFDVKTNFLRDLQFTATLMYDDINIPDLFSEKWSDRYAWQAGVYYADPFTLKNTSLIVEYTRVEPYVFSHGRSRDNSVTSLGVLLGPAVPPNGDSWFVRLDYAPERNLSFSARVLLVRHGSNVRDSTGAVSRNVGGDVLFPHRDGKDGETKLFLDGNVTNTRRIEVAASWEIFNQCWLEGLYRLDAAEVSGSGLKSTDRFVDFRLRFEL